MDECVWTRIKNSTDYGGPAWAAGCRVERHVGRLQDYIFGCPHCGKPIREKRPAPPAAANGGA